jgi:hypothetical protein
MEYGSWGTENTTIHQACQFSNNFRVRGNKQAVSSIALGPENRDAPHLDHAKQDERKIMAVTVPKQ